MNRNIYKLTAIAAITASMAMVGCSKQDQTDAKNSASETVAQADQKTQEMGKDAANGMDKAKDAAGQMAQDAKTATQNVGDKVADAVITTTVKAELAKDSNLSALKINVDTDNGRVALRGTAPSDDARERATTLAQGVKGVVGVDNALTIEAPKK